MSAKSLVDETLENLNAAELHLQACIRAREDAEYQEKLARRARDIADAQHVRAQTLAELAAVAGAKRKC